ncbi:MAG: hypothetical protein IJ447_02105 [Clostridia bacterium]|nr:hypothetical protein [Clostridia bacterium]
MAKLDFNIPQDFYKQLGKLYDIEKVAPKMLEEAAPILVDTMKSELSKHNRTAEMVNAVKAAKPKVSAKHGGHFITVYPRGNSKEYVDSTGKRRKRNTKVRNMDKLIAIEYGKDGQAATPVMGKIISKCENAVLEKMAEVYEKEVNQ